MKRRVKWVGGVLAVIVVLAIVALAAVPYIVDVPRVQALIATSASQALGRPVKFASMSITALPLPAVELRGLEIAEDPQFGKEPFLRLDTGKVRLRLRPLLTGRVELGAVILVRPAITVIQAPDGRLNVSTLGATHEPGPTARAPRGERGTGGAAGGGAAMLGSTVKIEDGVITYVARGKGDAVSRYRLESVDLTLAGGGPQLAMKGDLVVKPGDLAVTIDDGLIALANARATTDAALRGKVTLDAKDIGPLATTLLGPSPAYGGAMKGTLALAGTLGAPSLAGDVTVSKPTVTQMQPSCPEPRRRTLALGDLKLNLTYKDSVVSVRPVTTSVADGPITAQLTASLQPAVRVQVSDLALKSIPVERVAVDYLCQGYAITGPLDLTGALSFATADLWNTLTGPGTLKVGRGKVVGPQALALVSGVVRLGGTISSLLSADLPNVGDTPLEFDSITGTYQITNGIVTTRDLLYTSRPMKVAIAGTYALAAGRMDLDMVISHGRGELKAKVTGTAASPSIRVNPATILRDVDPGKVEKGLGDLLKRIR